MRLAIALAAAASIIAIQGCASDMAGKGGTSGGGGSGAAHATLMDVAGNAKGSAILTETTAGLHLVAQVNGMALGAYGIHLHMVGMCDAPDFKTAGGHWNPTMKMHGMENPQGHHMGDLPNLTIGADGTGTLDTTIPNARLTDGAMPLLDADGAALVIHAAADDYKTDPSGNSGARVACGVVTAG